MDGRSCRVNWLSPSVGKLGVMREMCRALQKDVNVWTERLSYRPKMAKTPREYWEQTGEGEEKSMNRLNKRTELQLGRKITLICHQMKPKRRPSHSISTHQPFICLVQLAVAVIASC